MTATQVEKALEFLRGVAAGNPDLAVRHVDPDRYLDHDPRVPGGAAGLWRHVDGLTKGGPAPRVLRVLEDGPFVVTQEEGPAPSRQVVFEAFRFEDGIIVEHWRFTAEGTSPNQSGHTQADGPTKPRDLDRTETNKRTVRDYYETVHLAGRHDEARRWFLGDTMIRHEPGVADGGEQFLRDLRVLVRDRTIDEIRLFAGQGDLVFLVARGTHLGAPCAYVDLYRVEQDKIVEHWGFPQSFPWTKEESNGSDLV